MVMMVLCVLCVMVNCFVCNMTNCVMCIMLDVRAGGGYAVSACKCVTLVVAFECHVLLVAAAHVVGLMLITA